MSLYLYNTLTRQKELFQPIAPPFVGLYVCGPTVYGDAHLGHARPYITFDVMKRYMEAVCGYRVRYVRNITDVGHLENDADEGEDKLGKKARLEQLEPMEVAQRYMDGFTQDMAALNILRPSIEPRATGHVPEQIEMIEKIIENGFAYVSNGSVYMDVPAYNAAFGYGILSGRNIEEILAGSRENLDGLGDKRHPADFALWKRAEPEHIMRWRSPWSEGFPGWHIECSAMSTKYLGAKYDIHGGGLDLIFPHHEAEIVQSNAAAGVHTHEHERNEAVYWVHCNMITLNGQKMAKSKGNGINLQQFFDGSHPLLEQAYSPMTVRFFILQAQYRSTIDFSNSALQAAEKALARMSEGLARLAEISSENRRVAVETALEENLASFRADCVSYMNDDLNTAKVIARIFEVLPAINALHRERANALAVSPEALAEFRAAFHLFFFDVLGLLPSISDTAAQNTELIDGLMRVVLQLRADARAAKNYATSDYLRDELGKLNIAVKDTPEGATWSFV
jgi:cysteinyl-tRNA synthetase